VLSRHAATDLLAVTRHAYGPLTPDTGAAATRSTVGVPRPRSDLHDQDAGPVGAPTPYLRLFGAPKLTYRGESVPLRRTAALQLLAYLAIYPDGADARRLAAALWPGDRGNATTNRLYITVNELRRALQATAGHPVVIHEQDRYVLDPHYLLTDVWQATRATRDAATAISPQVCDGALRRVIDLYHDDVAAGELWPWLEAPREQARQQVLTAYTVLAEHRPAREALQLLHQAMGIDPLNADLVRRAARVHAAAHDTTARTDLFTAFRRRLSTAGLPSPEDLELWMQNSPPIG
jgi:DNA-binding SARP family transcriptional activator